MASTTLVSTGTSTVLQQAQPVQSVKKEYSINPTSLQVVTGGRPIVVSYGYSTSDWTQTGEALKKVDGIARVWDYSISAQVDERGEAAHHYSASGTEVIKMAVHEVHTATDTNRGTINARRQCKAGLINVIFHNYRMMKERVDDFTPITFNVELSRLGGGGPITKMSRTTASEIEILRKLCTDTRLPQDFRDMARRTVKFVHVTEESITESVSSADVSIPLDSPQRQATTTVQYAFTEVGAPWQAPGYSEHRQSVKQNFLQQNPSFSRPPGSARFDWYDQVKTLIDIYSDDDEAIELEVAQETTTDVATTGEEGATEFPTTTPTTQASDEPTTKADPVVVSTD